MRRVQRLGGGIKMSRYRMCEAQRLPCVKNSTLGLTPVGEQKMAASLTADLSSAIDDLDEERLTSLLATHRKAFDPSSTDDEAQPLLVRAIFASDPARGQTPHWQSSVSCLKQVPTRRSRMETVRRLCMWCAPKSPSSPLLPSVLCGRALTPCPWSPMICAMPTVLRRSLRSSAEQRRWAEASSSRGRSNGCGG